MNEVAQCLVTFMCVSIQKFSLGFSLSSISWIFVETLLVVHSLLTTCQQQSTAHFQTQTHRASHDFSHPSEHDAVVSPGHIEQQAI